MRVWAVGVHTHTQYFNTLIMKKRKIKQTRKTQPCDICESPSSLPFATL